VTPRPLRAARKEPRESDQHFRGALTFRARAAA
jgi:hypothetical protein